MSNSVTVEAAFSETSLQLLAGLLDSVQIQVSHPDAEAMAAQAFTARRELAAALDLFRNPIPPPKEGL